MSLEYQMPTEKLDESGFVTEPGLYHFTVVKVEDNKPSEDPSHVLAELKFDLTVVGPANSPMAGKAHWDYVHLTEAARSRLLSLAVACGIVSQAEVDSAVKKEAPINFIFEHFVGRHFVAKTEIDEYQKKKGKERVKIGFDFFSISDPEVKHVVNTSVIGQQTAEQFGTPTEQSADDDPFD